MLEPLGISEIPGSLLGLSGGDGDLVTVSRAEVQAPNSDSAFAGMGKSGATVCCCCCFSHSILIEWLLPESFMLCYVVPFLVLCPERESFEKIYIFFICTQWHFQVYTFIYFKSKICKT